MKKANDYISKATYLTPIFRKGGNVSLGIKMSGKKGLTLKEAVYRTGKGTMEFADGKAKDYIYGLLKKHYQSNR